MRTQEEIINYENGSVYYKIYFEMTSERMLSQEEYNKINLEISKLIEKIKK